MGGEEESSDRPEEASYGGKAVVNTKRASAGGVGDDDMLRWWRVLKVIDRRLRCASPLPPGAFRLGRGTLPHNVLFFHGAPSVAMAMLSLIALQLVFRW